MNAAIAGDVAPAADTLRALAGTTDVLALGALADDRRRARHGQAATYARVHDLELADIDAWTAPPPAATEVRLVGHPRSLDEAVTAAGRARALAGSLVLRGFWLGDLAALDSADVVPVGARGRSRRGGVGGARPGQRRRRATGARGRHRGAA